MALEQALAGLKAAAEPTRLRLLALCARGDLSVSDLTQILGQSQPRVSRHLKLLAEAGLVERFREGAFAFFRLSGQGEGATLARKLLDLLPADDATLARDRDRLTEIQARRAARAAEYFARNAARWDELRSLHVPEAEVERVLGDVLPPAIGDLLDVGVGTGRMLELFGPRAARAVGVDQSREMLAVARANLERAGLAHCHVRQGDMYQLPFPDASFDAVTIHQVLHYAENPGAALREAARVLRPGGALVVVDFLRHELEALREEHAHARLGFDDAEIARWRAEAGLSPGRAIHLPGDPLTVAVWTATHPADILPLPAKGAAS